MSSPMTIPKGKKNRIAEKLKIISKIRLVLSIGITDIKVQDFKRKQRLLVDNEIFTQRGKRQRAHRGNAYKSITVSMIAQYLCKW